MKKLDIILIVLLIILLTILIGGGIYVYISLKPFLKTSASENVNQNVNTGNQLSADKHPLLTSDQEATLEKIGIDPAKLPTTITPVMESCFVNKLGIDRVNEIKAGEEPNAVDLFKAKSCIE